MRFRAWPAWRIALLSVGWAVLTLGGTALWMTRQLDKFAARTKSETGAEAISAGIPETAAMLFGPPLLLVVSWLALRGQARR